MGIPSYYNTNRYSNYSNISNHTIGNNLGNNLGMATPFPQTKICHPLATNTNNIINSSNKTYSNNKIIYL